MFSLLESNEKEKAQLDVEGLRSTGSHQLQAQQLAPTCSSSPFPAFNTQHLLLKHSTLRRDPFSWRAQAGGCHTRWHLELW